MDFSDRTAHELHIIVRDAGYDVDSVETLTEVLLTAVLQADACADDGQERYHEGLNYVTVAESSIYKLSRIATGSQIDLSNSQRQFRRV